MPRFMNRAGAGLVRSTYNIDSLACKLIYRFQVCLLVFAGLSSLVYSIANHRIVCDTVTDNRTDVEAFCSNEDMKIFGEFLQNKSYFHVDGLPGNQQDHSVQVRKDSKVISNFDPKPEILNTSRYQLYILLYFGIAFILTLPRLRWVMIEGKIIQEIVRNLNFVNLSHSEMCESVKLSSLRFSVDLREHRYFAIRYVLTLIAYLCALIAICGFLILYVGRGNIYFALDAFMYFDTAFDKYPFRLAKAFAQQAHCAGSSSFGKLKTDTVSCKLPAAKVHMLFMSTVFWISVGNIVNVFRELVYIFFKILVPSFARWRCRLSVGVSKYHDVGKTINLLGYGSILIVEILLQNLHRQRVMEILSEVRPNMENQVVFLKLQLQGTRK